MGLNDTLKDLVISISLESLLPDVKMKYNNLFLLQLYYVEILITIQLFAVKGETVLVFKEACESIKDLLADDYAELARLMSENRHRQTAVASVTPLQCENVINIMNNVFNASTPADVTMKLLYTTCQTGNRIRSCFAPTHPSSPEIKFLSKCDSKEEKKKDDIESEIKKNIVSIVRQMSSLWRWKDIFIISDKGISELYRQFSYNYLKVSMFNITNMEDIQKFFSSENLSPHLPNKFVVFCSHQVTLDVLSTAKVKGFLEEPQVWAIFSDTNEVELFKKFSIPFNSYVALISPINETTLSIQEQTSVLLLNEEDFETYKAQVPECEKNLADNTQENNIADESEDSVTESILKLTLKQVYSVNDGPVLSQYFGNWDPICGLTLNNPFPSMLKNLNGHVFKVATLESPPYILIVDGRLGGFFGEIFNNLAKEINFSYALQIPSDQLYGKREGNKWTGLLGLVVNGTAEIGMADISMTPERKEVVDFSPTIDTSLTKIFYKKPEEKFLYMIYILPFEWKIWVLITLSIFISGFGLYIASIFSPNSYRNITFSESDELKKIQAMHDYNLSNCLLSMYNGFVQQGSEIDPPEVSGKIIFITVYLSFVIVFSSYTSIFTSYLTIKETRLPIETLEELLKAKDFKLGLKKATSLEKLFENSTSEIFKKAYKKMIEDPSNFVEKTQEGLDRAYSSNYAFIAPEELVMSLLKNNCSFVKAEENLLSDSLHIVFKKNFIFEEVFKEYLERLTEGGIIRRLKRSYEEDEIKFCDAGDGAISLGFKRVVSLFLLLAGASFVSACFLVIERICNRTVSLNRYNINITTKIHSNLSWKISGTKQNNGFFIPTNKYNHLKPTLRTTSFPKRYHY